MPENPDREGEAAADRAATDPDAVRAYLGIYLKGMAMGAADMVPGVSGGTIALIAGIYDRLVAAIAAVDPRVLRHVARPHDPDARAAVVDAWRRMDLTFLVVLGTGMVTSIVVLSQVLTVALEEYQVWTAAFFLGLIAASAVLIGADVPWTPRRGVVAAVAALFAGSVAAFTVSTASPALPLVFVAGAVAISAMVLPGLSGALLLIILGQYEYLLGRLRAFLEALGGLATGGPADALVGPGVVVVAFLSGAALGLLTVARVVDYALDRARATTMAGLVGLMIGGLYAPAEIVAAEARPTAATGAGLLVAAAVGAGLVWAFDRATGDLDYV